jgi:predicted enzyme involved in methoxymalonyl-ACP biosynthesis
VLGRTVEETLLNHIFERAAAEDVLTIEARYIETKKNATFSQFYLSNGFVKVSDGEYTKRVAEHDPARSFIEISAQELGVTKC